MCMQDNAELKGQVRAAEKLKAEVEQALAAAERSHSEEAGRLRRISKKTAEELEEAQLQLKELRERLSTLELSEQQALRELQTATAQLTALQDKGVKTDSALNENVELKQVMTWLLPVGLVMCVQLGRPCQRDRKGMVCTPCGLEPVDMWACVPCGLVAAYCVVLSS